MCPATVLSAHTRGYVAAGAFIFSIFLIPTKHGANTVILIT